MLFGFPPQPTYLEAYTHLHHQCDPYTPLMIAGLDVDIMPLIPVAIKASKEKPGVGGPIHIRVGLEDAPLGTKETNESLVRQAVEKIRAGGADVATSSEVRTDLLALGERRRDWLEEVRRKEGYKI